MRVLLALLSLLAACFSAVHCVVRCPRLVVEHGRVINGDRLARFRCQVGFKIFGPKVSVCINGNWSDAAPVCVKPGCSRAGRKPVPVPYGHVAELMRSAVLRYSCDPGYKLEGPATLVCSGRTWNGTAPTCKSAWSGSGEPPAQCHFSDSTHRLCGWTPSAGLVIEGSSGQGEHLLLTAPSADLHSPVFQSPRSQQACFSFLLRTSALEGVSVSGLQRCGPGLPFSPLERLSQWPGRSDAEGRQWLRLVYQVKPCDHDFQLLIQLVGNETDHIAVDDLELGERGSCPLESLTEATPADTTPSDALASSPSQASAEEISPTPDASRGPVSVWSNATRAPMSATTQRTTPSLTSSIVISSTKLLRAPATGMPSAPAPTPTPAVGPTATAAASATTTNRSLVASPGSPGGTTTTGIRITPATARAPNRTTTSRTSIQRTTTTRASPPIVTTTTTITTTVSTVTRAVNRTQTVRTVKTTPIPALKSSSTLRGLVTTRRSTQPPSTTRRSASATPATRSPTTTRTTIRAANGTAAFRDNSTAAIKPLPNKITFESQPNHAPVVPWTPKKSNPSPPKGNAIPMDPKWGAKKGKADLEDTPFQRLPATRKTTATPPTTVPPTTATSLRTAAPPPATLSALDASREAMRRLMVPFMAHPSLPSRFLHLTTPSTSAVSQQGLRMAHASDRTLFLGEVVGGAAVAVLLLLVVAVLVARRLRRKQQASRGDSDACTLTAADDLGMDYFDLQPCHDRRGGTGGAGGASRLASNSLAVFRVADNSVDIGGDHAVSRESSSPGSRQGSSAPSKDKGRPGPRGRGRERGGTRGRAERADSAGEFSDLSSLICDEHLDFTEQQPQDHLYTS